MVTSERWTNWYTGEAKENTEWHSVEVYKDSAVKFAETYLKKGRLVYVEGRLETRKWYDKSGYSHYLTLVVIRPYFGLLIGLDRLPKELRQRGPAKPLVQPVAATEFTGNRPFEFGTNITVEAHDTGECSTYQIVPVAKVDVKKGLISRDAPLANALIGHAANDVVEVQTPGGVRSYTIIKIEHV